MIKGSQKEALYSFYSQVTAIFIDVKQGSLSIDFECVETKTVFFIYPECAIDDQYSIGFRQYEISLRVDECRTAGLTVLQLYVGIEFLMTVFDSDCPHQADQEA